MATLEQKGKGHRIKFSIDGERESLFLGAKYSKTTANELKKTIETLIACRDNHQQPDKRVMAYLETAVPEIKAKLEKVGLIKQEKVRTLGDFIAGYVKERTDWKARTFAAFSTSRKRIQDFFGKNTPIEKISVDDAVEFRLELQRRYSEATVSKIIKHCRQVFNLARRRKLIADSPFETVRGGNERNPARYHFVTMDEYRQLLEGCTNAKQRLIIALARIGGLRCPSELCGLRWSEIDWQKKWFWVHAPKTEHHKGKDKRLVLLFPELEERFREFFDTLPEGCGDLIFPEESDIPPVVSLKKSLGSWISKVAKRSGMELWEKPFQNCRSSRDTELRRRHPQHLVNGWIGQTEAVEGTGNVQPQDWVNNMMGHSQKVAEDHYIQPLASDFVDAYNAEKGDTVSEPSPESSLFCNSSDRSRGDTIGDSKGRN